MARIAAAVLAVGLGIAPLAAGASAGAPEAAVSSAALAGVDKLYLHRNAAGNLDASVRELESLLESRPGDPAVLWRLGRSLVRVGERFDDKKSRLACLTRAQGFLEKAVALDGSDPEAHYWLGVSVGRQGELRGIFKSLKLVKVMKKEMESVLAIDPNHGGAHHVLGEMYKQMPGFVGGSRKKSLRELELAFERAPNYTAAYAVLAESYRDAGYRDKAKAVLNRLFEVKTPEDPAEFEDNLKEARELLKKL